MVMALWKGISKAVTPMVPLVELAAITSRSRPRALLQAGSYHRAYHVSAPLSRIHSPLQQQKQQHQQQNHRRYSPAFLLKPVSKQNLLPTTTVQKRWHGGPHIDHDHADSVHVSFLDIDGNPLKANVDAYVGESLLQVAQRNDIELEGACEGVCACSTCHVVIPDEDTFDELDEASEDEEDMLDMAYGLTETSRLGCQITITRDMDGMEVEVPPATRNFYVDGHVPKPH